MIRLSVALRHHRVAAGIAAGGLLLISGGAQAAGTATASLGVSAEVTANCSASVTPLSFSSVDTLSANATDDEATLTVTCTNGTAWSAVADAGGGQGATMASRVMTGTTSGNKLNYALYTDSQRTTIWGDGSDTTATISDSGSGSGQEKLIYAAIPAQSGAKADSYNDTVNITVTY